MRIGRYEVGEELGRGGMGRVLRARDDAGHEVAVKLLDLQQVGVGPELVARFMLEIQAAGRVQHPAIARVLDAGREAHHAYLVMELLAGGTLADRLRQGPLPAREAVAIMARLAEGVQAAHAQRVLHRDLKPDNVLFDLHGLPYLADFGLARLVDATRMTRTGEVLGTPNYMAPEQALGEATRIGPRTDVYGLGATLYACLSGRPPFLGGAVVAVMSAVVTEPPPPLPEAIDPRLRELVGRCLAKEPAERPTVQGLIDALHAWQAGSTPGAPSRAGRGRARWLGGVAAALAVGGVLALASVGRPGDPATAPPAAAGTERPGVPAEVAGEADREGEVAQLRQGLRRAIAEDAMPAARRFLDLLIEADPSPALFSQRGDTLLAMGEYDLALEDYGRAQRSGGEVDARLAKAQRHRRQRRMLRAILDERDWDRLLGHAESSLTADASLADDPYFRLFRGVAQLERGHHLQDARVVERGAEDLRFAANRRPTDVLVLCQAARAERWLGNLHAALCILLTAHELRPEGLEPLFEYGVTLSRAGLPDLAAEALAEAEARAPTPRLRARVQRLRLESLSAAARPHEVLALIAQPGTLAGWWIPAHRALAYYELGQEPAMQQAVAALRDDRGVLVVGNAHPPLLPALLGAGLAKDARLLATEILASRSRADPSVEELLVLTDSYASELLDEPERALRVVRERLDRLNPQPRLLLRLLALGEPGLDEQARGLRWRLDDPYRAAVRRTRAWSELGLRDFERAKGAVPDTPSWRALRAWELTLCGRHDEAEQVVSALIDAGAPVSLGLRLQRAWARARAERWDEAAAAFRESIEHGSRPVLATIELARLQRERGAVDEALATLEALRDRIPPDDPVGAAILFEAFRCQGRATPWRR